MSRAFYLFEQTKYKVGHDDYSCSSTFIFSHVEVLSAVYFIPSMKRLTEKVIIEFVKTHQYIKNLVGDLFLKIFVRMESSHIIESVDCDSTTKPKDRLVNLLDQIELHVEQLRRDAWRLEEEKDTLLSTLDTIRNNELLGSLEEPADKDDVLRYAERLSMRCLTVDVLVKIQRDNVQQEALHQVNGLIDSLIVNLRQDPSGTRQKCAAFMNACSSQAIGHSDKNFETAILGCTLDDQKRVKKRLQGLLDYIDKMHTIEFQ
ncbi:BAG family molecular chaperone regulator 2 isoform X1 [Vespa crabro]|uniref:BAG family molecular chaperone regulator 2 isoform X1 n=2 Tax=Vespa TaxID=7443 RepID=UPI001F00E193|nr:BAG family molecular chaperone regulator 2 isoform X1 [Vespa crabro]